MQSVLITGCSSGFGLETAKHFLERGWRVVATMRTPRGDLLPRSDRLQVLSLDVTDAGSIRDAVAKAGPIDVLVNNAGVGLMGVLEGSPMETTRTILETNTIGTIALTRALLPQFRQRRNGVIVNVTSAVTFKPLPLLAVYTASKAAVEAFSESLALELAAFNVRVRLVLPGYAPATRFGEHAMAMASAVPDAYAEMTQGAFARLQQHTGPVTTPQEVAAAIWRAATDPACPARLPAGEDAVAMELASRAAA